MAHAYQNRFDEKNAIAHAPSSGNSKRIDNSLKSLLSERLSENARA
jgi:hypothetical protein